LKEMIRSAWRSAIRSCLVINRSGAPKGLRPEDGKFLMTLALGDQTIYDVGAYKGYYTLFFSRAVGSGGKVIAFEPHPDNHKKLLKRIKLNLLDNVEARPVAVGNETGRRTLAFRDTDSGTSSLQEEMKAQILHEKGAGSVQVAVDSLDRQVAAHHFPKPDLIKIDVEGFEMDVLLGMSETIRNHKPKLYIEIHGVDAESKIANVRKVVEFLSGWAYTIHHVESGAMINPDNSQIAKEGHLYCT